MNESTTATMLNDGNTIAARTSTATTEIELEEDVVIESNDAENKDKDGEGDDDEQQVAFCGACKKRPVGTIYKPYRGAQGYVRLLPCRCHICKNCMIDYLSTVIVLKTTTTITAVVSSSFPCGCPVCYTKNKKPRASARGGGGLTGYAIVEGGVTVHRQDYSSTHSKITTFQRAFTTSQDSATAAAAAGARKPPPVAAASPPELPPTLNAAGKATATVATQTDEGHASYENDPPPDDGNKRKRTRKAAPSSTTTTPPLAAAAAPAVAAGGEKPQKSNRCWKQKTFDERLQELAAFKAEFGHCRVPYQYAPNQSLGEWVKRIRQQGVVIGKERFQRLNEMGFDWEPQREKDDRDWKLRFEQLQAFKAQNGHCRVPWKYAENPPLAEWVNTQRRLNNKGKLRADRKRLLESVHFSWSKAHAAGGGGGNAQSMAKRTSNSNSKNSKIAHASQKRSVANGNPRPLPHAAVAAAAPQSSSDEDDDDDDDDDLDEDEFEPYLHDVHRHQFGFF